MNRIPLPNPRPRRRPVVYYTFKVFHEEGWCVPTPPRADPMEHEHPYDFCFNTPHDARVQLQEDIDDENVTAEEAADWILCKVTVEPLPEICPD
jgi:hypothetical protein